MNTATASCPPFWTEDPAILLRQAHDFFPFHAAARRCTTTALNSLTRFGLYLGIVLAVFGANLRYFLISVGIAIIAAAAYSGMKIKGTVRENEAFSNIGVRSASRDNYEKFPEDELITGSDAADEYVEDIIGSKARTGPTGVNPFMNVLLTEIGDNPMRPPAQNGETLKRQFSNVFQDRVYGDAGDVFQKTQNQRVWVVQPNTSIPNDQESFQNWLFRVPGRSCKEGNALACKPATDGGALTWINQS
jgi:hypothetical protein